MNASNFALTILLLLLGCSTSGEATAAPTTDAPAADVGAVPMTVESLDEEALAGRPPGASVSGLADEDGVTVTLTDLIHYCQPDPSFEARLDGEALRLVLQPPEGPVSRCVGSYDLRLSFPTLDDGAAPTHVVVEDVDGQVRLEGAVRRD